jgi:hypothetical protein
MNAISQTAIRGKLIDELTGEPMLFANVGVAGTTIGAITDFEGNFSLESTQLKTGSYEVQISFISYETKKITDVKVTEGKVTDLGEIRMAPSAEQLEAVQVIAKVDKQNEAILLMEQKEADVITQSIGAQEMSRKGVSDVAAGLTKVSGISVVSGNAQMYVRGLGDRYNSAMLNGMPIASPNPELKVIPMDIFPTAVVENVGVSKVFLTDKYADYAGALVDIKTKDYPENAFVEVGVKSEYNTQATGKNFKYSDGGNNDILGFDDGTRSLPTDIQSSPFFRPQRTDQSAEPFNSSLAVNEKVAPMNFGASIKAGKTYKKDDRKFGTLASLSFDNDYNIYDGVYRVLTSQYEPRIDYDYKSYVYSTNVSGLVNLSYDLNKKNSLRYVLLYVHSSEDDLSTYEGYNRDQGQNFLSRRATYHEHSLLTNQLIGRHEIGSRLDFDWAGNYAIAQSNEPDRRQVVYMQTDNGYIYNSIDRINNNRFWSNIEENEISGRSGFTYKLSDKGEGEYRGKLKFGVDYRSKNRAFKARQFYYDIDPGIFNNLGVDPNHPENEINDESFSRNYIYVAEQPNPSYEYSAYLNVMAFYTNIDFDVTSGTKLGFGLRYEYSDQTVNYKKLSDLYSGPFRKTSLVSHDVYPNLNVRHSLNEKSNLRAGLSRTISRPEFKEMAPFLYEEIFGGMQIQGNEHLKNAYNYNLDLKYELFQNTGELFAASLFGRYLQNPIERIVESSSSKLYSFQNAREAYVFGVEFEYTKKLSSLIGKEGFWSPLSLGFNTSLLYSRINIDRSGSTINTNDVRQLQGASPYLVNADVNYKITHSENANTILTLTYNVFGPRIYSVGVLGAGDIYERPVNTVDFIVKNKLSKRFSLDFSVKNILNQNALREQETGAESVVVSSRRKGVRMGLSMAYTF